MVKNSVRFFLLGIVFLMIFMFFLPKANLFYFVQRELKESNLLIDFDTINENGYTLSMTNTTVYLKDIDVLKADIASLDTYLFYNTVVLEEVKLSSLAKEFLPLKINEIKVVYTLSNPTKLFFNGDGEIGKVQGNVDLLDKKVFLILFPSSLMKKRYLKTLRYFHKNKNGELYYEYKY